MTDDQAGPTMICATKVLKSEGTRVGRVAGIQLPRTVRIVVLVGAIVGALVGLWVSFLFVDGITGHALGAAFGGMAGWAAVSYSPLPGESLAKWFELQILSAFRSRYVNGRRAILAVGVARVATPPRGHTILRRSAVRITPNQYDERGVPRSVTNQNLDPYDRAFNAAATLATAATTSLTPAGGTALQKETR